ncbi:TetR/AcrR family transcriptional regulator C-terminal domain-containing protein [Gryllotalpicola reticulitermitis]|uniref:TetR/AcrR family transcriptional regulator C-terminal domain-containing protein n=1 Tax=Gryllotalpicola reticulitermitis TaxID=1184153 RepID=A0ABV8Q276_9MICO
MARRSPGTKAGLTRDLILRTALAIADTDGLRRLTIRRLADRLGVEPMSVYGHLPNKQALLDGLVEAALPRAEELALAPDAAWEAAMRGYAIALRRAVQAHPGVHSLLLTTQGETATSLEAVETALRALTREGFPVSLAAALLHTVMVFVIAHTVNAAAEAAQAHSVRITPTEHPLVTQLLTASDPTDPFTTGLDAILLGFGVLRLGSQRKAVESSQRPSTPRRTITDRLTVAWRQVPCAKQNGAWRTH